GDGGVLRLAAARRDHRPIPRGPRHVDDLQGFRQRADLVWFDEYAVGDLALDAELEPLGVGDEQVVAYQLDIRSDTVSETFPAFPIVFRATILNAYDEVMVCACCKTFDHFST